MSQQTAARAKQVRREDLPEVYQKAGNASARSQKSFLLWNRINFLVLTLAAILSAVKNWIPKWLAILGAALLGAGAVISFWLRKSQKERRWYSSRAVAESVKTLSWRYMMCASPFEGGSDQADALAAAQFDQLVHDIATQEAAPVPRPHEITPKMEQTRRKSVTERANLYLEERIEGQRSWYAENSEGNDKNGTRVLYLAAGTQAIACVIAMTLVNYEIPDFGGVFATASASALAWMQVRKYEDLAQAYGTAAKELSRIGSAQVEGFSEQQLSRFVLDAENAISREHTLWLAKRA